MAIAELSRLALLCGGVTTLCSNPGTVDQADMDAYVGLGTWVNSTFATPVVAATAPFTELTIPKGRDWTYISIMEDQTEGQSVWSWTVEGQTAGNLAWTTIAQGQSIGHRRIATCRLVACLALSSGVAIPPQPPNSKERDPG